MMRNSIEKASLVGIAAVAMALGALALGCVAHDLELIAPVVNETLQYRTDEFVIFFSPSAAEAGLEGLRVSITNTTGNTMSIVWEESFFVLPNGDRSDAVASDIPSSFQMLPTQIPIRQTSEVVAVPLSLVSHGEDGWSLGVIDFARDPEFTFHLAVEYTVSGARDGYDFAFRATGPIEDGEARLGARLPIWSALLALGMGFLLGLFFAAP